MAAPSKQRMGWHAGTPPLWSQSVESSGGSELLVSMATAWVQSVSALQVGAQMEPWPLPKSAE